MKKRPDIERISTGVRNLDVLLRGGVPKGSATIIGGTPGAGKTTLTQQICFHHAAADQRVVYFNTLSEPTAKTLRYVSQYAFFDRAKLGESIHFVDLGVLLRSQGIDQVSKLIMTHLKKVRPAIVVIDSFKVFDDLTSSREELRKFGYELAINLMAWETTTFLLGEYGPDEIQSNPLFSIIDGIVLMTQRQQFGEEQRFLQVSKMRGTDHSRDPHPFFITPRGIEVFAPRATIRREDRGPSGPRCKTGLARFDELLGEGIPRGSSLLVGGVAGTGKTVLLLEFVYRGALAGEKGIVFSFEETAERLLAAARGLGWDLDGMIASKMVEIVFIPQPDIMVEAHLVMMQDRIAALGARRVAVDSVSVFLHKVTDPQFAREKIFQLTSVIQNAQAVAFLATDIPYGTDQISRFGVEETVVDGVVILSATAEGLERHRYIEVYKLRNTAHLKGRHDMIIGEGGMTVFPREEADVIATSERAVDRSERLSSGVPGLDGLTGGGLLDGSVTFVAGSAGIGKSTLGMQFLLEGALRGEPGLFVALEEDPEQLRAMADGLGLPLAAAVDDGLVDIIHLAHERVRPNQVLAILTDRLRATNARRVVLDGATHLLGQPPASKEVRQLLDALVTRFRALGTTSVLTFETRTLEASGSVTDRGVSPLADNLVMLRYRDTPEGLRATVTVVKTRGSAHDFKTHDATIGQGGMRVGRAGRPAKKATRPRGKRPPKGRGS